MAAGPLARVHSATTSPCSSRATWAASVTSGNRHRSTVATPPPPLQERPARRGRDGTVYEVHSVASFYTHHVTAISVAIVTEATEATERGVNKSARGALLSEYTTLFTLYTEVGVGAPIFFAHTVKITHKWGAPRVHTLVCAAIKRERGRISRHCTPSYVGNKLETPSST